MEAQTAMNARNLLLTNRIQRNRQAIPSETPPFLSHQRPVSGPVAGNLLPITNIEGKARLGMPICAPHLSQIRCQGRGRDAF
jgi:hypothetical protein